MESSTNYSWDFDRPSAEFLARYQTFSVGIFQWVTKASGKGLKKTGVTSRVLGYTEDPDRVFEKATQICRRLNAKGARAQRRPAWLQKQYSIPRPVGMVVQRRSEDFTAGQVRSMRLSVMKEKLIPAGFVVGKDATYVRRADDQIHLINFQGSKYGHEFTVNLGFHYAFVAPLFRTAPRALTDFHLLGCLVWQRIGHFLPERRDVWFQYGKEREALIERLTLCAATCLNVFERCALRWRDPLRFWKDSLNGNRGSQDRWDVRKKLGLGYVELKIGRLDEARKRLDSWHDDRCSSPPPEFISLSEQLTREEARAKSGLPPVGLRNWLMSERMT
jgi:hypothetical protein